MLASRAMLLPKLPVPYIMLLPNKLPKTLKKFFFWSCDLKQQYTFIISQNFCWSEICNCLSNIVWLQNSRGIQSNFGRGFSHLKAWLRPGGPLPRWLAGCWRAGYLSSPSIWASSGAVWAPHYMVAGFTQRPRKAQQCLLWSSLRSHIRSLL